MSRLGGDPLRARLAVGAGAVLVAAATAAAGPLHADRLRPLLLVVGVVGVAALATALAFAQPAAVLPSLGLVGGAFALSTVLGPRGLDSWALLEAVGLVTTAELAYWSLELRPRIPAERGLLAHRAGTVGTIGVGTAVVAGAILVAASARLSGSSAWTVVGIAAVTVVFALLVRLAGITGRDEVTDRPPALRPPDLEATFPTALRDGLGRSLHTDARRR
jgi:hypothetical protein